MLKRIRKFLGRRVAKPAADVSPPTESATHPERTSREEEAPAVHIGPRVVHRPISRSDLDPEAVKIVGRLTRFDHTAYLVGGCVRDLLLEGKPKDFDVATSATPRQIKRLFRNCRIIGRRFRLAHIYFQNGKIIEVATFRARDTNDGEEPDDAPLDGDDLLIREDNVFGTAEQDALRRDFTINSLFYDVNQENVIDHADGLGDLRRRLVRTIGEPAIRFREDPIRTLRAIKFAARLDFAIEAKTLEALRETRDEIHRAAPPRVLEEINRFCRGGAARRSFELLQETGVLQVILPEIAAGCAHSERSWAMLLALFTYMDRQRGKEKHEIQTGEILAVLVLPLLAERLGWGFDGTVEPPKGLDVRDAVDTELHPLSLRLRIPRREQERCRQILVALARMVPARQARRGGKRTVPGRDSVPDALWILGALAGLFGGAFAEAYEFWNTPRSGARGEGRPVPPPEERGEPRGPRRRRGSRGRRSRGRGAVDPVVSAGPTEQQAVQEPRARVERTESKPRPDMPPPWDDDYFFAALPTAPEGVEAKDDGQTDRYGASRLRGAEPVAQEPESPEGDAVAGSDRPRRRRRSRRRRRRPAESRSGEGGEVSASETDPAGTPDGKPVDGDEPD